MVIDDKLAVRAVVRDRVELSVKIAELSGYAVQIIEVVIMC